MISVASWVVSLEAALHVFLSLDPVSQGPTWSAMPADLIHQMRVCIALQQILMQAILSDVWTSLYTLIIVPLTYRPWQARISPHRFWHWSLRWPQLIHCLLSPCPLSCCLHMLSLVKTYLVPRSRQPHAQLTVECQHRCQASSGTT